MKRFLSLILVLLLAMLVMGGVWTSNNFIYKPTLGAKGAAEKTTFDSGQDRVDTRLGKEVWVGDPNYGATLQTAIAAIGATSCILRVPAGTHTIAADLTVLATTTLQVERGAIFAISTTKTLTINGSIIAGPYQIFSWTGTGKVVFGSTSPQVDMYPEWWGAVGDNSTDDLAAFNAAVTCAKDSGKGNIILSRFYKLSSTLSLIEFYHGPIRITGQNIKVTGFTSEAYNYPAIEVIGCYSAELSNFEIYGSGTAGKIPTVAILTARSGAVGAHNANFMNLFHHLYITGYYQRGAIADLNGSDNRYSNIETYTTCPATDNNWAFNVCFDGKRTVDYVVPFSLVSKNGTILIGSTGQSSDNLTLVDSAIMHYGALPVDSAGLYLGGGWGNCRNVYFQQVADADSDVFKLVNAYSWSFLHCSMEVTALRYVFNISRDDPALSVSDIWMNKMKGGGAATYNLITDATTELKNCVFDFRGGGGKVKLGYGASNSTFSGVSSFELLGGPFIGNRVMLTSTAALYDISLSTNKRNNIVTDPRDVAGKGQGDGGRTVIDGDLQVGAFALDYYRMSWGSVAPTTRTWAQGAVSWNNGASATGSPGWICTHPGTFGTLAGVTGSITTGTKLLTTNITTNLDIGDYIDVVADGGGFAVTEGRIVNINTTTKLVTLAANATATATGTAVSFHNDPTFAPMANSRARTSGLTGAIATGATVTHGLGVTPVKVLLTAAEAGLTDFNPSALGATTFVINFAGGGTKTFYWEAIQ